MSQEQKANLAQSTLVSTITSGATSLTVTSATTFPTIPQFRLIIGTELLLVTGVSGAVFTVTRGIEGTTAVAHTGGAVITLVETEAGQVRFQRDWSNPLWGVGKPMQLLNSSGTTLTASSFTDVNMTNASKTDLTGGAIVMTHDTQGAANDVAMVVVSAPTAPWVLTVGFIANLLNQGGDFPSCGPVVRENATGEFYQNQLVTFDGGTKIQVAKYTSPTATASVFVAGNRWSGAGHVSWMQIEDDNVDLIFRASVDGVNFVELGREARLTFLTPDEIGFGINNFAAGNWEAMGTIVAWDES